jgi:hypothetical protein
LFKGLIVYRLNCAGPDSAGSDSVGPYCAGPDLTKRNQTLEHWEIKQNHRDIQQRQIPELWDTKQNLTMQLPDARHNQTLKLWDAK